jgi:hypothetical protein
MKERVEIGIASRPTDSVSAGAADTKGVVDNVENLMLDLVEWVGRKERTYRETMDAWRTSCPRLPVWEDATDHGFVVTIFVGGRSMVRATPAGFEFLKRKRPHCYEQLRRAIAA